MIRNYSTASGTAQAPRPRRLLGGLLLGCLLAIPGYAQTNQLTDSRYLIIVDTSRAMKRRAENVQRIVADLLKNGMNGQLRPGDTVGLWTFNDTLHAGKLPLIRWVPERRSAVATRVSEFLGAQKYENRSKLEVVLASMHRIVTNSPKLTVLLVSDGTGRMSGTPFDDSINAAYGPFRDAQKEVRMPFVTVLRAKDGEFLGYTVTPSPWDVEFPKFPPEPIVVTPKPAPQPETKPAPPPPRPPLIVIGSRPENTLPSADPSASGTEPQSQTNRTSREVEKQPTALPPEQSTNSAPPAQIPPPAATATPDAPAQPVVAPPPTPTATPSSPPDATSPAENTPAPTVETKTTAPGTSVPVAPITAPVEAPNPVPTGNESLTDTNAATPSKAQAALILPESQNSSRLLFLVAGVSLFVIALLVVYALVSRRQRNHVSLITSSLDHHPPQK